MARKKNAGPCPDPLRYILVKTKEGSYWRLRRGLKNPVTINKALKANAGDNGMAEAKRVANKLIPYLENMNAGRKTARMGSLFREARMKTGSCDFSRFKGFEIQKDHLLGDMLKERYQIKVEKGMLTITIPINKYGVKPVVHYLTHYYLEAILLYGDPGKDNKLRTESDSSERYEMLGETNSICTLTLQLPKKQPWMVWLKLGTFIEDKPGNYDKLYGMRVVETSFDCEGAG